MTKSIYGFRIIFHCAMQHISFANSIKHNLTLLAAKVSNKIQLNQFNTFDLANYFIK